MLTSTITKFTDGRNLSRVVRVWVPRQYTELDEHLLIGSIEDRNKAYFITVDPDGCVFYFSVFDLTDDHFSSVTSFGFGRDYESIKRAAMGVDSHITLFRPTSLGSGDRIEYKFKNSVETAAMMTPHADGQLYIIKVSYGDDGKFLGSHVHHPETCDRRPMIIPSQDSLT